MKILSYQEYTQPQHTEWIVFIHGAGGSSKTFGRQIAAFRSHFNLLLPDLRDHGNSKDLSKPEEDEFSFRVVAHDVLTLMREKGIKQAHFIGISMGSIVIRIIEDIAPDVVSSVIIGGGVMKLNQRTHLLFKTGVFLSRFIPYHKLYQLVAWILMPYRNHKVARRLFVREAAQIKSEAFKVWLGLLSDLKKNLDTYFNKPFKSPLLLIMGSQDFNFLDETIDYWKKFPFTNLDILPKCGHVCNIEKPEEFNQRSLNFLLQLSK